MRMEKLMACFCKAREAQEAFTKCLEDEELTQQDRELLFEIIQDTAKSSWKIKEYCLTNNIKE